MFALILRIIVFFSLIVNVMRLSCMKLFVQDIIYLKMSFLRKLCNKRIQETWLYVFITFIFSNVIIFFFSCFKSYEFVSWVIQTSFRMLVFDVCLFVCQATCCVFSLTCWFCERWSIQVFCLWYLTALWICKFWYRCNYFY